MPEKVCTFRRGKRKEGGWYVKSVLKEARGKGVQNW